MIFMSELFLLGTTPGHGTHRICFFGLCDTYISKPQDHLKINLLSSSCTGVTERSTEPTVYIIVCDTTIRSYDMYIKYVYSVYVMIFQEISDRTRP